MPVPDVALGITSASEDSFDPHFGIFWSDPLIVGQNTHGKGSSGPRSCAMLKQLRVMRIRVPFPADPQDDAMSHSSSQNFYPVTT
jgi:hypothetical protein